MATIVMDPERRKHAAFTAPLPSAGAEVILWEDNGGAEQLWYAASNEDGTRSFYNKNSGKALSIRGDGGDHVLQYRERADLLYRTQAFHLEPAPDGRFFHLKSVYSSNYLAISHNANHNGAPVIQWWTRLEESGQYFEMVDPILGFFNHYE